MKNIYETELKKAKKIHEKMKTRQNLFVQTSRKIEEIDKEIKTCEAFQRVHKNLIKDGKKIEEAYFKSVQENEQAVKDLSECIVLFETMSDSTAKRKQALENAKKVTILKVNKFFTNFLKEKGMEGRIDIYHENIYDPEDEKGTKILHKAKTLEITALPKHSRELSNDLKSLSGGERSFSTVCFMVSMWDIASTPFRILDEVDVFMDPITRRLCLDMLITFAEHKSSDQFLFLSPLAIPDLKQSPKVKIFQMPVVQRS